jgi:hypothetical protein
MNKKKSTYSLEWREYASWARLFANELLEDKAQVQAQPAICKDVEGENPSTT